ncbi:MAG TPA: YchJ family protein [Opitutus sp.]|nr:YchJ family protein [Opitutus sp.]
MSDCPCGSGRSYETCCEPIIAGAPAPTAEALMRSRYTAYVKHAFEHLGRSLSAEQRKDYDEADARRWAEKSEWLGLKILRTERGGPGDEDGLVEFAARFRAEGTEHEHLETALFAREDGKWVYAGQAPQRGTTVRRETPKVGRNDPCPCGSGKKYKKCCGAGV